MNQALYAHMNNKRKMKKKKAKMWIAGVTGLSQDNPLVGPETLSPATFQVSSHQKQMLLTNCDHHLLFFNKLLLYLRVSLTVRLQICPKAG
jgi:hypothetical protein